MSVEPRQKLGPYEVLSPLGRGGMGEVYKARDTRLDRGVKLLDFGIAKWEATDSEAPTDVAPLTREGALVGTIAYMAPEQLERKET